MTIHSLDTSKDDKHDESNFGPKDGEVFNVFFRHEHVSSYQEEHFEEF